MNTTPDRGWFERLMMDDGAEISLYRVGLEGPRKGGLVLLQGIFGITNHIREQCDRFAGAGYEVMAPAIFHRMKQSPNRWTIILPSSNGSPRSANEYPRCAPTPARQKWGNGK
jgi:dienelactone hydrolase